MDLITIFESAIWFFSSVELIDYHWLLNLNEKGMTNKWMRLRLFSHFKLMVLVFIYIPFIIEKCLNFWWYIGKAFSCNWRINFTCWWIYIHIILLHLSIDWCNFHELLAIITNIRYELITKICIALRIWH